MNIQRRFDVLPYDTVIQAVGGSYDAISVVLAHYSRYIDSLSRRVMYDASGRPHIYVDEQLKMRIQNKLIQKISNFRI